MIIEFIFVMRLQISLVYAGQICGARLQPCLLPPRAEQQEQTSDILAVERLQSIRKEVQEESQGIVSSPSNELYQTYVPDI
jgi:hypothetical protein